MSYSISLSGHGAEAEKAKKAFRDLVKALDEATPDEGVSSKPGGQIQGSGWNEETKTQTSFFLSASDVRGGR